MFLEDVHVVFLKDAHVKDKIRFEIDLYDEYAHHFICEITGVIKESHSRLNYHKLILTSENNRVVFDGEVPRFTQCEIITEEEWVMS